MAILKCKMCGGDLKFEAGATICECEYCGSKQTIPSTDDEKRLKLYERANRLRFDCEFDKAAGVYESIVAEYQEEAEAYWGLVLCKYGIEYVDDPATKKKIPTCHRSSFDSVMDDSNFDRVMENSDALARGVYREEAKRIEEIRKGIIKISSTEEPYDIFICYKETAEDGQRTIDSVIAQDVYDALTEKGYRVFFSRISLEDKLGQEYEPYIFAALNSAKIMLAFGTSYDYYNAVWVKNEWSRFLQLIAAGQKKTLIPCYKNLDAYDMPKEFKHLQAQDMGKVGAIQDLLRGIGKILGRDRAEQPATVQQSVVASANVDQLIKRGNQALEDGEWKKADEFFESALNQEAENGDALLGKWLAKIHRYKLDDLLSVYFGPSDEVLAETLEACPMNEAHISSMISQYAVEHYLNENQIRKMYAFNRFYTSELASRKEQKERTLKALNAEKYYLRARQHSRGKTAELIEDAVRKMTAELDRRISVAAADDEKHRNDLIEAYNALVNEADAQIVEQHKTAIDSREANYQMACERFKVARSLEDFQSTKQMFLGLGDYKEAKLYVAQAAEEEGRLRSVIEEEQRRTAEALAQAERERQERKKKIIRRTLIGITAVVVIILACLYAVLVAIPSIKKHNTYNDAVNAYNSGNLVEAKSLFETLQGYKDADEYYKKCAYVSPKLHDEFLLGEYRGEPIEWVVIGVQEDRALVVSKYVLARKPMDNEVKASSDWKNSDLRQWLNESFYNDAFSDEQSEYILESTISNKGGDTDDKIFCLSVDEISEYNPELRAQSSIVAETSTNYNGDDGGTWWWLRSQDNGHADRYDYVKWYDGKWVVDARDGHYGDYSFGVRPAMWIKTK